MKVKKPMLDLYFQFDFYAGRLIFEYNGTLGFHYASVFNFLNRGTIFS